EELAEKSTFIDVAYLLIYGKLPTHDELETFRWSVRRHTLVHEDMKKFFDGFPSKSHPMGQLSALVGALSAFYPESLNPDNSEKEQDLTYNQLMVKMRTIVSWIHKKALGHSIIYPSNHVDYGTLFLYTMFGQRSKDVAIDPLPLADMITLLIKHADLDQNGSTS